MRLAPLVLLAACSAADAADVMDPPAMAIGAGISYLTHQGTREVIDEGGDDNPLDTWGYYAYLGFSAPQKALVGYPWLDFPMTRHVGNDSRIDTLGVLYIERVPISDAFYIGIGVGSFYNDVRIVSGGRTVRDDDWTIGAKGVLGAGIGKGLFVEAGYQYTADIQDLYTSSANLCVGIRF